MAEEDGRYLAHDLVRQLVCGHAVPAPGVGQGGLVGAHPGHAVFVDGQNRASWLSARPYRARGATWARSQTAAMVNASYPPVSSSSTPVSDFDLYSDEVLADPYPAFRVIRNTGPAVQLTAYPVWVIARHADVRAALRDWRTFTSAEGVAMIDEMNAHMRGSVLASDPPEHGVLRGVLSEKLARGRWRS